MSTVKMYNIHFSLGLINRTYCIYIQGLTTCHLWLKFMYFYWLHQSAAHPLNIVSRYFKTIPSFREILNSEKSFGSLLQKILLFLCFFLP